MASEPAGDRGGSPAAESPAKTLLVALLVCLVCSSVVAGSVVLLRPRQLANLERERQARVLEIVADAPGLTDLLSDVGPARLEARVVELETGAYADGLDPATYDAREAARDPERSTALPDDRDLAGIGRRPDYATVYLARDAGGVRLVVLPVYGSGYTSTLYGYLALDPDGVTVRGLSFYEHGETPGLGGQIDTAEWSALWPGKRVRDASGELRIEVVQGSVDPADPEAVFQVDGISGATRTGRGVTRLLRFWLGPDGFEPYLRRLRAEETR